MQASADAPPMLRRTASYLHRLRRCASARAAHLNPLSRRRHSRLGIRTRHGSNYPGRKARRKARPAPKSGGAARPEASPPSAICHHHHLGASQSKGSPPSRLRPGPPPRNRCFPLPRSSSRTVAYPQRTSPIRERSHRSTEGAPSTYSPRLDAPNTPRPNHSDRRRDHYRSVNGSRGGVLARSPSQRVHHRCCTSYETLRHQLEPHALGLPGVGYLSGVDDFARISARWKPLSPELELECQHRPPFPAR